MPNDTFKPSNPFTTTAWDGFKFIGAAIGNDDTPAGELFEGLEVAKNEDGVLFLNRSEDPDEPDWVDVHQVYMIPITVAVVPFHLAEVKLHPDWRL